MDSAQLAQDIKTAKNHIRTFGTEIRKADAEMRAFGKSSDTLSQKKKSLTSQLKSQEKAMELLNEAYTDQVEKSGEGSQQSQKLKRDINNLGAEMAKTQGKIDLVNQEISEYAESSDGAGDSTIDLYNNIAKSNDQLKTNESNLKSAESAVKLFGASQETLKDKISALGGVQDAQKDKMEALQAAYDREVSKSGESSAAAQKLATEMGNLQAAMNNTQGEIDKTTQELSELGNEAPQVEQDIGAIKTAMEAMVMEHVIDFLSRVGDKLLEIGKNAVLSAADIQAHNALFEQVFGNMNDGAEVTIDKIDEAYDAVSRLSQETGIMGTSLEEGFLGMAQQFQSLGTGAEESLALSERAMLTAADAAAAYNMELGDAQGLIQSFIKGNNSAAERVGIFARESNLLAFAVEKGYVDTTEATKKFAEESSIAVEKAQQKYSKAVEKYGEGSIEARDAQNKLNDALEKQEDGLQVTAKEWANLDESLKQAARVEYIENMYGLANVTGQAAREADEWNTVTQNLTEAQRQLYGALGEQALEMLIPVIKSLTDILLSMLEVFKNLSPQVKKVITVIAGVIIVLAKIAPVVAGIVQAMLLLQATTGASFATMAGAAASVLLPVLAIGAAIAAVILVISKFDEIMAWGKEKWPQVFVPLENAIETVKKIFSNLGDYISRSLSGIFDGFGGMWEHITSAVSDVLSSIKAVIESFLTPILNFINENQELILSTFKRVWDFILLIIQTVMALIGPIFFTTWYAITNFLTTTFEVIKQVVEAGMNVILGIIKIVMQIINGDWAGAWESIKQLVSDVWLLIQTIIQGVLTQIVSVITSGLAIVSGVVLGVFNAIATFVDGVWNAIGDFVMNAWEKIKTAASEGATFVKDKVSSGFTTLKNEVTKIWEAIKEFIVNAWDNIKESLGSAGSIVNNVISSFRRLRDNIASIFNSIKNKITDTWNNVKDKISSLNPLAAEQEQRVNVIYDDDPYSFNSATGYPTQPGLTDTGTSLFGAISAINSSVNSIKRGTNSTFNGLNDLYNVPINTNSLSGKGSSRQQNDPSLELLSLILEAILEGNNKSLDVNWQDQVIAKLLYKPLKNYGNIIENRRDKSRGVTNY